MEEEIQMGARAAYRRRLGVLITVIGGMAWGFSGCCGQFLFEHRGVAAAWLVGVRLILAGILLCVIGLLRGGVKGQFAVFRNKKDRRQFVLYALFGVTMSQFAYFMSVQASNAGTATVIQYVFPAVILAWVCIKERRKPNALELLAMLLVLFGVFLLGTGGSLTSLKLTPRAIWCGFLSMVAVTVYNLLSGDLVQRYGICSVLGNGMILGALVTLPLSRPWESAGLVFDFGMLGGLFGVVVLGTAIAYSFYLLGVSMIGPLQASMLAGVEPLASVLISALWLKTPFSFTDYLGIASILVTLVLLSLPKKKTLA